MYHSRAPAGTSPCPAAKPLRCIPCANGSTPPEAPLCGSACHLPPQWAPQARNPPASDPAVENLVQFGLSTAVEPAVAWVVHFAPPTYFPAVFRWTPSSRAMRRWAHPLSYRRRIASCKLTLRTWAMPQSKRPDTLNWSRFYPSKVVHFKLGYFDRSWYTLIDR